MTFRHQKVPEGALTSSINLVLVPEFLLRHWSLFKENLDDDTEDHVRK